MKGNVMYLVVNTSHKVKMKYAVSDKGIVVLQKSSKGIINSLVRIYNLTATVQLAMDDYSDTLGPHKLSLNAEIKEIYQNVKASTETVQSLAKMLNEVAEAYQEIIDNDLIKPEPIESNSHLTNGGNQTNLGSFPGRNFKEKQEKLPSLKFGSFEIGKYHNGTFVVKGENFDRYMSNYYNSEKNMSNELLGEDSIIETISPSKIEGIFLNSSDVDNNSSFWNHNRSDESYTADSFKRIASYIPEVKRQLDAGKHLSEIRENPYLEKCVSIYFDPSNMPQVIKCGDYYEFYGNGRHRILAARELGYSIPVRIVGIRRYK